MSLNNLKKEIKNAANPERAEHSKRFFKTGKGQYGEGEIFVGLTVPQSREIAKKYLSIELNELKQHLSSKFHEERLVSLLILVEKYKKEDKKQIFDFYLDNLKYINNWDLVDLTAPKIVGKYLINSSKEILYKLAKSSELWEKRVSIIATYEFIINNKFEDTFRISEILLNDSHDLIHKAVGWMLREIGKRSLEAEESFLKKHYKNMPRTMLRYAIERFPEEKRQRYLKSLI